MINVLGHALLHFATGAQLNNCGSGDCSTGLPVVSASGGQLHNILQIFLGVIAAITVLMMVIGGLRFVLADNPQDSATARNTLIYAAVGLVITLSAEALVSFVLGKL